MQTTTRKTIRRTAVRHAGLRHSISKGISPLIASVLLVAFTMSIAGIMAAWATTFAQKGLTESSSCALSMRVLDAKFSGGKAVIRVVNENSNSNMTELRASLIYTDQAKNTENIMLKSYNNEADPLAPSETQTIVINTTDNSTEPNEIEIRAGNCPKVPARARFGDYR